MTAITKYERLEASGLWRASPEAQRRDVILSLGEATLTLSNMQETALTHWSLPAIVRLNPGQRPALFAPGEESEEELELDDDTMIRAIEKVRSVVEKRRSRPGRLRHWVTFGVLVSVLLLAVFWLPGALRSYAVSVVPDPTRAAVGQRILNRIGRVAGEQCNGIYGRDALEHLTRRVFGADGPRVIVLSDGVQTMTHLPGHIILMNRALIEDYEEPDVAAGFLLAEELRREQLDPMLALLEHAGLMTTAKLLTTGDIPNTVIDEYAESLLTSPSAEVNTASLLARFETAAIRSTPYAYALDISGETTLDLIEGDPVTVDQAAPLLRDLDWVSLQGICGE